MLDRVSKRKFAGALTLGWALLATGCPPDKSSTGTLVVPFELGNHRTCDALSIKTVRAELDDGMYVQEAPCTNGAVRFKDVPAGSYNVRMFGVDDKGVEVLDSLTDHELVVNVVGQDTTVVVKPAVTLTAAPAHLLMRWNFGFGTCKGVGVDRFAVTVWRSGGDNLLLDATIACSTEGDGEDQYREVKDDSRQLPGDTAGEVSVQPLDKTGVTVGDAVIFDFSAPGAGHDIKLSLTCEDGACKGSGKPD
jgi:hypothetical protein